MITALLGGIAANPWIRVALRYSAIVLAVLLFLLSLRRSGERVGRLAERLDAGLAAIGGFTPLRIFTDSTDRAGVAGYTVDGLTPPADTVRASFGAGTTVDDIDRILDAFRARTDQTDRTRPGVNR